jgi:hypothetical protein
MKVKRYSLRIVTRLLQFAISWNRGKHIVLIRIGESSVALTPFGSLIRVASPVGRGAAKSWTKKLRAMFALFFR